MEHFDVVVIGTSPVLLLDALDQARSGKSVLIIEQRDRLGGAWSTKFFGPWGEIETGCHYIENIGCVYDFLRNELNIRLVRMDPQPFLFWHKQIGSIDFYGVVAAVKDIFFWSRKRDMKMIYQKLTRAGKEIKTIARKYWNGRVSYEYPVNGCGSLINQLYSELLKFEVTLELGCKLNELVIESDGKCRGYVDTRKFSFGTAILGASTELKRLSFHGSAIDFNAPKKQAVHLTLHIRGQKARAFTYIDIIGDSRLERVSDVGMFSLAKPSLPNDVLLSARVVPDTTITNNELAHRTLDRLMALRLVNKDAYLIDFIIDEYNYCDIPTDKIDNFSALINPYVIIRKTRDLGLSILEYEANWKRASRSRSN